MKIQDNNSLVTARFFLHPVKNEVKSKQANRPIFDDVEHVKISFAANKQSVLVAPAHEVFAHETNPNTGEKEPVTYALKYNEQYRAFKSGADQGNSGTPLEMLSFLTPGKRLELKALNIHTAETLASLGGQALKNLGMGGRELVDQAAAFIESATAHSGEAQLVDQIAAADARISALEAELAAARGVAVVEDADDDPSTSPFADWEEDDIRNWLAEAAPEMTIDKRWGKKTLLTKADEVNAALAKQNALKAN